MRVAQRLRRSHLAVVVCATYALVAVCAVNLAKDDVFYDLLFLPVDMPRVANTLATLPESSAIGAEVAKELLISPRSRKESLEIPVTSSPTVQRDCFQTQLPEIAKKVVIDNVDQSVLIAESGGENEMVGSEESLLTETADTTSSLANELGLEGDAGSVSEPSMAKAAALVDDATVVATAQALAADVDGLAFISTVYEDEPIWTDWTRHESGTISYRQTGGSGGASYGRYQFDKDSALPRFLQYCINTGDEIYASFAQFIDVSGKKPRMVTTSGLSDVWIMICDARGEAFYSLQTAYALQTYYAEVKADLLDLYGINLSDYSAVTQGSVFSIAIRDGNSVSLQRSKNNLRSVTDTYVAGINELDWLCAMYDAEARRHPTQVKRWGNAQKNEAISAYLALSGNTTQPEQPEQPEMLTAQFVQ